MQFKIITIGKIKNRSLNSEIDELKKRISRFEIIELKEVKEKTEDLIKRKEFELIKPYLDKNCFNILLLESGKEFDTKEFYNKLKTTTRSIQFIITGAFGPSEELKRSCDMILSLSKMTFTHEQALYMLVEQIYRVQCFEKNIPYTK